MAEWRCLKQTPDLEIHILRCLDQLSLKNIRENWGQISEIILILVRKKGIWLFGLNQSSLMHKATEILSSVIKCGHLASSKRWKPLNVPERKLLSLHPAQQCQRSRRTSGRCPPAMNWKVKVSGSRKPMKKRRKGESIIGGEDCIHVTLADWRVEKFHLWIERFGLKNNPNRPWVQV